MRKYGIFILLFQLLGCARYEYDIVSPPELARHVGGMDSTFAVDDLEYRLVTVESRLVVRIYNRTKDQIHLVGPSSAAVDPHGQSHALPGMVIPPDSFIKLIVPPPEPYAEAYGPSITFGAGVSSGGYRASPPYDDAYFYEPRYYRVYDPNDPRYWSWNDLGEARLILTFDQSGTLFKHEFVIARRKMK